MRRCRIALLAVAGIGCGQEIVRAPPPPADGSATILYRAEAEGYITWYGASPGEVVRFDIPSNLESLVAFMYSDTAEELQLGPGRILGVSEAREPRRIPEPIQTMIFGAGSWQATPFAPYFEDKLGAFDYQRCVAAGGCTASSGAENRCVIPCPIAAAPVLPTLPEPTCPPGWSHPPDDRCEPQEPDAVDCPADMRQPTGNSSCIAVGAPCAADGWPIDIVALYVRPGANGVGTKVDPLGRIEDALAMAMDGDRIALAEGEHRIDDTLTLTRSVGFVGACTAGTKIRWAGATSLFQVTGAALELDELTLEGTTPIELVDAEVRLQAVIVGAGAGPGILATASRVSVHESAIRERGNGAVSVVDGFLTLANTSLVDNHAFAISAVTSTLTFDRLRTDGVLIPADDPAPDLHGFSMLVRNSVITGREVVVENNERGGLTIAGSVAVLTDLVVRDSGRSDLEITHGLTVQGSTLTLQRAQFARCWGDVLFADSSALRYEDILINDSPTAGAGLYLAQNVVATVERMRVENGGYYAIVADNFPDLVLRDITVRGGSPSPDDRFSTSVLMRGGGISVERMSIEDSDVWGMNPRTELGMVMRDLTFRRDRGGMTIDRRGGALFERILVEDCLELGISVELTQCTEGPCRLNTLRDVTIRDMKPGRISSTGLQAILSSVVDVESFEISGGEAIGMFLDAPDGDATVGSGNIHDNGVGISVKERISEALAGIRTHDNAKDLEIIR